MSSRFPSLSNPTYKHSVVSLTIIQKTICPFIFRTSFAPHPGGNSHIKVMEILIVLLLVPLKVFQGRKVTVICPFRYRSGLCINNFTKKCRDTQKSPVQSVYKAWATDTLVIPYGLILIFQQASPSHL